MQTMTKNAIAAIMAADDTATVEERARVVDALSGEWTPLSVSDVANRLGFSRPKIYALLRAGILERTADGRVSTKSVADYCNTVKRGYDIKGKGAKHA